VSSDEGTQPVVEHDNKEGIVVVAGGDGHGIILLLLHLHHQSLCGGNYGGNYTQHI
jgi:hypothetical protein